MVLEDPQALVAFAESLGCSIGSWKEKPTLLLSRLLQLADGFYETLSDP